MAALGDIGFVFDKSQSVDVVGAVRYYLAGTLKDTSGNGLEGHVYLYDVDGQQFSAVRRTTDTSGAFIITPLYSDDVVDMIAIAIDSAYNGDIFLKVAPVLVT